MRGAQFLHGMMVGSVLLVVAGSVWLVGKPQLVHNLLPHSATEQPDMRVQDVHVLEQTEAGETWELVAHEAELYDATHLTVVRQMRAYSLLPTSAQPLHVVADYGQLDNTTGDLLLRGHVRLTYLEEYTVLTDILHWQAASRSVHTSVPVKIESALVRIAGSGFLGQVEEQRFVLQDDVHATFQVR